MKKYILKDRYIGFRINSYDNRFREDLSQGECELLYNSGFSKFFDVVEVEEIKDENPVSGKELKVKAVKPKRGKKSKLEVAETQIISKNG